MPLTNRDAGELAHRILVGDAQAEAQLVEHFGRGLLCYIRRLVRDPAAAEDLRQETLRIAIEKVRAGDLREPEKLAGFLCGLARNLAARYYRSAAPETAAAAVPSREASPLDRLLARESASIVRQILEEMPVERDRQILFRFYIAEEPKEEICRDLGLDGLQFNRVLHRARDRYRELHGKRTQ